MNDFPETTGDVSNPPSLCEICLENYRLGQDFLNEGLMKPEEVKSLSSCTRLKSMCIDTLSIFIQRLQSKMENTKSGLTIGTDEILDIFTATRQEAIFNPLGKVDGDACIYLGPIAWHFSRFLLLEAASPPVMDKIFSDMVEIFSTNDTKSTVVKAMYKKFGFNDDDSEIERLVFEHNIDTVLKDPMLSEMEKLRLCLRNSIFDPYVQRAVSVLNIKINRISKNIISKLYDLPDINTNLDQDILYQLNYIFLDSNTALFQEKLHELATRISVLGLSGDNEYVVNIAKALGSIAETDTDEYTESKTKPTHPGFAEA
ncbi:hypothetical protein KC669_02290 [Candidatus Dojkabacteria bacterium]|uniref:Uncharacterized protein n=1 Tax=Candidatus Dojkabacteria bacterium TaxID=2099670 RepID=A0A955LA34_9BACT|nr:hypothetical protein [Candidatus Dojkabacteria bacterium]